MTTGMKFDVIIKDYPFPIGKNLSRNDAEDMAKRKSGKVVPAGSKK